MNELKDDDKKLQELKNKLESKYNENVNKLYFNSFIKKTIKHKNVFKNFCMKKN